MSQRLLKRPTLIILGLGEAGQKILYQAEKLAYRLGILDPVENLDREKLKSIPIRLPYIIRVQENEVRGRSSGALGSELRYLMKRSENGIVSVDKAFIRPTRAYIELNKVSAEDLARLMRELSPVISTRYGFSMLRIDLDEQTLMKVGTAIYSEGLPVPPGISIVSKEAKIDDPILGEPVPLQPTGGSGGRSTAVYQLLRKTESSIILDLLGIPMNIEESSQLAKLPSAIPSYVSALLIHGLVGTGAGTASAILETLQEIGQKDLLSSRFKIDFTIIPSAEEAHMGKLDPSRWVKVFKWDVEKLVEFVKNEILDVLFTIDLDFAVLQYKKNQRIGEKGLSTIRLVNEFIKNILDGKLKLYRRDELRKYTGLSTSTLLAEYDNVDELIAYALEPILCIHGPRGIRFGVGGSSIDEMELKDMMKGSVVIPMVSPMNVFNTYLAIAKHSVEKGEDAVDEASLAVLLLPVLHGMMAPMVRDMVNGFIIVVNTSALKKLENELGYIPTASDIATVFREIFTSRAHVKVLISSTSIATSIVVYALVDPEEHMNHVIAVKGWQ